MERFQIKDWYYRAEGNCSLVIANNKEHVVIRLLKRKKRTKNGKKQRNDPDLQREQLQKGVKFAEHVMQPLIGRGFVHLGKLVELNDSFPEEINNKLEASRPAHRLHMEVNPDCLFGIQLPDFCFVPSPNSNSSASTFCIEIKPKCGYLPSRDKVSASTAVKSQVCYYCMYQHLKLKTGKWSETSGYCPIDLFSGNASRMKHALRELFKTPQNNLRLFKDGEVLLSQEIRTPYWDQLNTSFGKVTEEKNGKKQTASGVDAFQDLILRCLLHVPETQVNGGSDSHLVEQPSRPDSILTRQSGVQFCDASSYCGEAKLTNGEASQSCLPSGCVLQKLLSTQLLDDLDIEGVRPLYERVAQLFHTSSQNREKSHIDGPYKHFWEEQDEFNHCIREKSMAYCINKVKQYLVARTVKDCSIMISLRPLLHRQNGPTDTTDSRVITDCHGNQFLFSMAVIDLDPKPFDKFPTYIEDSRRVVEYYMSVIDKQQQEQQQEEEEEEEEQQEQEQQQQQQQCSMEQQLHQKEKAKAAAAVK